jgi:phage baseplate assembly protein W
MSDIAFPLSTNSLGNFDTAANYSEMWKQRVLAVLCTPQGLRVMRPRFGSTPQTVMFENLDDSPSVVKSMVGAAFSSWLPELSLQSVTVTPNENEANVTVDIWYSLPNGAVDTLTTLASSSLNGYGVL